MSATVLPSRFCVWGGSFSDSAEIFGPKWKNRRRNDSELQSTGSFIALDLAARRSEACAFTRPESPTKALTISTNEQGVEQQTRAKDRGYVYIRRDEAGSHQSSEACKIEE